MKKYYRHKTLVAAHRGNSKYFPENTLSSFKSALTLDVDMVETDIHMTKDGELVLMHDHTVDRTTDGTGEVRSLTLAEIKKLDAAAGRGSSSGASAFPPLKSFSNSSRLKKKCSSTSN